MSGASERAIGRANGPVNIHSTHSGMAVRREWLRIGGIGGSLEPGRGFDAIIALHENSVIGWTRKPVLRRGGHSNLAQAFERREIPFTVLVVNAAGTGQN